MPYPYRVVIAFRPLNITGLSLIETVASDATIQMVYEALCQQGFEVEILRVGLDVDEILETYDPCKTVIFNYCDGYVDDPSGYDPVTQLFERLGFAFTGADDYTLQWSWDKAITKARLTANSIPTPMYQVYERPEVVYDWMQFPAIVKPARQHGSIGIRPESVVETHQQLALQVEKALDEWKQPALVEDFINGDEYRVGVWGNGRLEVLPLSRIQFEPPPGQRYELKDFDTKWGDSGMDLVVPAEVDSTLATRIAQVVKASFRVVDMRDYGAVDVRLRDNQPYVIDPNQNPDISQGSSFVYMAQAAGLDYAQMLARIVRLAAKRMPQRGLLAAGGR